MNRIHAFVAHSFAEDDASVVGRFLKYFEQISKQNSNFTWETAESAEPKVLADKVRQLLADKNVLVAICTKNQRVIVPGLLRRGIFQRGYLKARDGDFDWRSSDWILQEIGFAIGRGLQLIILLEEGTRQPGGLLGDFEYVPFERDTPEKSFGKILEMITALSPKPPTPGSVMSDAPATQDDSPPQVDASEGAKLWTTPQPDWKRTDYEFALHLCILENNEPGAQAISAAYLATETGSEPFGRASWEACREYFRLEFGTGGNLAPLRKLAAQNPENGEVLTYLARALLKYEQYDHAAEHFRLAANASQAAPLKLNRLRRAAVCWKRSGHNDAAASLVVEMKAIASETESGEKEVLLAEKELAEIAKDDEVLMSTMERLVDLDPSDKETRFSLALKHSEFGNKDLALLHYSLIPNSERSSGAWNNLGVAYEQLELPAKAVRAYRTAVDLGETLAMSNIADRFIGAGFLEEARAICTAALAVQDHHKNVAMTVGRLEDIPDQETKRESELLKKAKLASDFYRGLGHAVSRAMPPHLPSSWKGPDCPLLVSMNGTEFVAVGDYTRPRNSLFALALLGSGTSPAEPLKFRVEFRGTIKGRMIEGTVSRKRADEPDKPLSLLADEQLPKVLMALSDDGSELRVLERVKNGAPSFYSLRNLIVVPPSP